ncbi:MAG: flagellar biosynthesis protein FliQ [Gracilibacteraceae bacterium]|jgi:flagellar biosynthetic protein FliQ|nr:flagellar biosynthesis protein FliQ [Gracilibacteraceae bacterium]MDR1322364.1 flagellar biosynthesis protein FliQ [Gracilibacteraceae bacterium]
MGSEIIDLSALMQDAIFTALKLVLPLLGLSLMVGLIISIFQSATQINEQTLTFVPKLLVITAALMIFGSWMLQTLMEFTRRVFALMILSV